MSPAAATEKPNCAPTWSLSAVQEGEVARPDRLFSFISQNWRGQPLLTHAAIVSLIAATRTKTGLKVRGVLDTQKYPKNVELTDEQMFAINLKPAKFHGDWNYTILPRRRGDETPGLASGSSGNNWRKTV